MRGRMAFVARYILMGTIKLVTSRLMIELRRFPIGRSMTARTVRRIVRGELRPVNVGMTGLTVCFHVNESEIRMIPCRSSVTMTLEAGSIHMLPFKRKFRLVVIVGDPGPIVHRVTRLAAGGSHQRVNLITVRILVAGQTGGRSKDEIVCCRRD